MSPSNLIRSGAIAAMMGSVLLLTASFVFLVGPPFLYSLGLPVRDYPAIQYLQVISLVVALLLVPVGMVGFNVLQRPSSSYGREAHFGFWLVILGSLGMVWGGVVFVTLGQWGDFMQATPPLGWVVLGLLGLMGGLVSMVVGFGLYGVATLQARVLPRWCGVAFITALPAALASSILLGFLGFYPVLGFFIVFGLVWLALGYALWARREAPAAQHPMRVR
jgi:hypothetical protein